MKTNRLYIEKAIEGDFEGLVKLHTCPIVRKYLGGKLDYDLSSSLARDLIKESSDRFWVIKDKKKNFLGTIELSKHHDSNDLEVSYMLMSDAWGRGYAKEALEKVIEYSRNNLKLDKILAETQTLNLRSVKLLKKCGFKEIKKLKRFGEKQSLFEYKLME